MANNKHFKVKNDIISPYVKEFGGTGTVGTIAPSLANVSHTATNTFISSSYTYRGFVWKEDGTRAFFSRSSSIYYYIYSASFTTPYDISTGSTTGGAYVGNSTVVYDIAVDPEGTKVTYIRGSLLYTYTMRSNSPWEWDALSVHTHNISNQTTAASGIAWNHDGTILYLTSYINGNCYQYSTTTPYSVAGLSYVANVVLPQGGQIFGCYYAGDRFYHQNNNRDVYEFSNPTDQLSDMVLINTFSANALNSSFYPTYNLTFRPDNYSTLYMPGNSGQIFEFNVEAPALEIDFSNKSFHEFEPTSDCEVVFKNPPEDGELGSTMISIKGDNKEEVDSLRLWDDVVYVDIDSMLGLSNTDYIRSLRFSSDGTKCYVIRNWAIYELDLSTPWDITTVSYNSVQFDVSTQSPTYYAQAIEFKPNGSSLYVAAANNQIYQYNLTTPWDLSTASYASLSFDLGTITDYQTFLDFQFKESGEELLIYNRDSSLVEGLTYVNLTTAWDISSISSTLGLDTNLAQTIDNSYFAQFTSDGENLFVADDNGLKHYKTNGNPFNITILSYNRNVFDLSTISSIIYAGAFGKDDKYFFAIVHRWGSHLRLARFPLSSAQTIMWPGNTSLDLDANESPPDFTTDVYRVSTSDGGATYQVSTVMKGVPNE